MTVRGDAALRRLVLTVIGADAGSNPDVAVIATAASRAYEELARVTIPLIGALGVDALTDRAVYLAKREYPWLGDTHGQPPAGAAFLAVVASLNERDAASATGGAAAVLAELAGLLVTLIGEGLTLRLLRDAWPVGFSQALEQEADT
jgi:hypothetical protein